MELGIFTSGYQRYPLERAFSDAGRLGYDYIELWGGRPHAFAPDLRLGGVAEIRSMVEKYQMPVYVYTPEHNAYPYNYMAGGRAQWEDSMEYLELCLEMGKALGAEYTLISVGHGGYSVPRRALWARLMESLRRLADRAEALDHKILLESLTPWESNLCTTAGELAQALEEVDSPCLLGMCDVVAPAAAGEPVENYLDLLASNGVKTAEETGTEEQTVTGTVEKVAQAVIEGTSHYYLMLEGSDAIYDVSVEKFLDVIRLEPGMNVTLGYQEGKKANTVTSLELAEEGN